MEHIELTHQQQIEAFKDNQTLTLIKSQSHAIKRAMNDCQVFGEDYFQEGILVVLKKLKTWIPSKGSLTTHCWLDLRCKFKRLKYRQTKQSFLPDSLKSSIYTKDSEEFRLIWNEFLDSLTPLERKIVFYKLSRCGSNKLISAKVGISLHYFKKQVIIIKNKLLLAGFDP